MIGGQEETRRVAHLVQPDDGLGFRGAEVLHGHTSNLCIHMGSVEVGGCRRVVCVPVLLRRVVGSLRRKGPCHQCGATAAARHGDAHDPVTSQVKAHVHVVGMRTMKQHRRVEDKQGQSDHQCNGYTTELRAGGV